MGIKDKNIKLDELINDESFQAFVMKKCSDEESAQWEEFIASNSSEKEFIQKNKDIIRQLSNNKKHSSAYPREKAKETLLQHINLEEKFQNDFNGKTSTRINWNVIKVAASLIMIIGIAATIYYLISKGTVKIDTKELYTVIDVPAGEKSKITLADGTEVWINSESKLTYPNTYNINNRNIYLEGEAYFDVTHNKNLPFIVNTPKVRVQALGTQFDVKSYLGDKTFQTTVVSGSVLIENTDEEINFAPLILKPDERAILSLNTSELNVSNTDQTENKSLSEKPIQKISKQKLIVAQINPEVVTSWKDHLLVFDNETLEEIAVKMSRWYRVDVEIGDTSLMSERYTGKFIHNETIDDVLEAIKVTTPIYFTKADDKIFINRRRE